MGNTIAFGWPQIIYICLLVSGAVIHLVKHGEPRKEQYNFWGWLIGAAINIWILSWGGFFG